MFASDKILSSAHKNLTITFVDAQVFRLNIDGYFIRFVKESELTQIISELNLLLNKSKINIKLPLLKRNESYSIDLAVIAPSKLIPLLFSGVGKKPVRLPESLRKSSSFDTSAKESQLPVTYSYRDLTNYMHYWSKDTSVQCELFKALVEDLIEIPYVDMPTEYLYHNGGIAFHANHGTTHALRQVEYAKNYIALVETRGNACWSNVAKTLSSEEHACILLALMLFRAGRTNEASWSADMSFGPRSAAIFKQIALDLGFNKMLVRHITECFDYYKKEDSPSLKSDYLRKEFYRAIIKLSHETDLIRCNSSFKSTYEEIRSTLVDMLEDEHVANAATNHFIRYSHQLCQETGAPVMVLDMKNVVSLLKQNRVKSVYCANHPIITMQNLNTRMTSYLKERNSLSSEKMQDNLSRRTF